MGLFNFTYPITRPLPYSWFKWVVLVGGILLVVLLSVANLASNGYDLIVQHSVDPNATIASYSWTDKLPLSLDGKTTASCEAQNLQVTNQYFTNKLGLTYTLTGVWQTDGTGKRTTLPSLQYLNNPLEECNVTLITLDFDKWDDRTASEIGWYPWGLKATGYTTCLVDNGGHTRINLTTQYEFVVPTIETGIPFQFVGKPDAQDETGLYWGQSLLSWYWMDAVHQMDNASLPTDLTYQVIKGSITFQPSTNDSDIASLDFFAPPNYHFVTQDWDPNTGIYEGPDCCINPVTYLPGASIGALHAVSLQQVLEDWPYTRIPDVWIPSDTFAKVFLSTILTDLGRNNTITALNNAAVLEYFSKNITTMRQGTGYNVFWYNNSAPLNGSVENWLKAGPARTPYKQAHGGNLTVTPSMLYSQYVCQVPRLKSTGSVIFAILVADLVILKAAWTVLNWITVAVMQSRVPTAHYCAGCIGDTASTSTVELVSMPQMKVNRSYQPVPNVY